MDTQLARDFATDQHHGQFDRLGRPLIDHVTRVAGAVPEQAQATAWLHDVLERTDATPDDLHHHGLSAIEVAAVGLLTRQPGQSFEAYVLEIVCATGEAGDLAQLVKIADLQDHVRDEQQGQTSEGAPPYRWALRHLLVRREQLALLDAGAPRQASRRGVARQLMPAA